jgi:hypothetical protein
MKTFLALVILVGVLGTSARAERPRLDGREAPRATDLLRAEKLAEQAEQRLKLPARRGPGWKRGGSGWETNHSRPEERHDDVIINFGPTRRRVAPAIP